MTEYYDCLYYNSVLGLCDIDGRNCPCDDYEVEK